MCHSFKVVSEGFGDCTANRRLPLQFLSGQEHTACPLASGAICSRRGRGDLEGQVHHKRGHGAPPDVGYTAKPED